MKCPENVMRNKLLQFPLHRGCRGNEDYNLSSEGHLRSIKYVSFDFSKSRYATKNFQISSTTSVCNLSKPIESTIVFLTHVQLF